MTCQKNSIDSRNVKFLISLPYLFVLTFQWSFQLCFQFQSSISLFKLSTNFHKEKYMEIQTQTLFVENKYFRNES